jgi:hypothetical protein
MAFTSPFILLALIPWAALALWLLRGHPPRQSVPFLPLWQGPLAQKPSDRSLRPPPPWVTAALLAALLSILAAAGPVVQSRAPSLHLTVLLDRGATMSALGEHRPRYMETAELAGRALRRRWGSRAEIELVDLLTGDRRQTDASGWIAAVASYRRTAVDTTNLIAPAIAAELARAPQGPLIVLTDHPATALTDPRLCQLTPQTPWRNVGITSIAARERPSPQVMIALRNDSDLTSAKVDMHTAGQTVSRSIPLPPRGQTSRQFIDVPRLGDTVEATLDAPDGCDADNQAYLVRDTSPPPRLEIRSPLSEPIRRMVSLYARANPSPPDAGPIALVNRTTDLPPGDSGAIIESPAAASPLSGGEAQVVTHPVTAVVDWPKITRSVVVSAAPSAREWTPLVTLRGHTLVAVRELPSRQVWVGFDSPQFPREPDFVVFWTNVFNWLRGGSAGGDRDHFTARPVAPLSASWSRHEPPPADVQANVWPGLYAHPDGRRFAANALDLRPGATQPTALAALPTQLVGGASLSPWLLLTALACLLVSAATWRRPVRAAGFSPGLHPSSSLID